MYSGHTCVLTSAALFILEYSPKRWWIYHYLVTLAAIVGVISIGIAHEVIIATVISHPISADYWPSFILALFNRYYCCLLCMYAPLLDVSPAGGESRPEECLKRKESSQTGLVVAHIFIYGGEHQPHTPSAPQPDYKNSSIRGENQALIVFNFWSAHRAWRFCRIFSFFFY